MSTDPQALRALAHPLRWKLIDVLEREGDATATRCAELTGESVASCAYHLGILAKYGYVEASPGRTGREKPWRLTGQEQRIGNDDREDIDGELAAQGRGRGLLGARVRAAAPAGAAAGSGGAGVAGRFVHRRILDVGDRLGDDGDQDAAHGDRAPLLRA